MTAPVVRYRLLGYAGAAWPDVDCDDLGGLARAVLAWRAGRKLTIRDHGEGWDQGDGEGGLAGRARLLAVVVANSAAGQPFIRLALTAGEDAAALMAAVQAEHAQQRAAA